MCAVNQAAFDPCVSGEVELVALEDSVTRALQLVRQARIAGCALSHCMHRGAVELHSDAAARRLPPSSASCSFLTVFCNLLPRLPLAALESAKRSAQEQQARAG